VDAVEERCLKRVADLRLDEEEFMASKRETIKNRAGTFYGRRDQEGQFKEMDEKGRSLTADRAKKAKTVAKKGQGDKGDQKRPPGAKKRS
jgi:hypothetical protein